MNLADVMDQVADQLKTVAGLRVYAHPPGKVDPPAAVVSYPDDYDFDRTYGRGMDRMTLPLVLLVPRPTERQTRDTLAAYCDGSGTRSVKAVLESGTYSAMHTVRVVHIDFDVVSMGGTDYAAALFDLDITGAGSP